MKPHTHTVPPLKVKADAAVPVVVVDKKKQRPVPPRLAFVPPPTLHKSLAPGTPGIPTRVLSLITTSAVESADKVSDADTKTRTRNRSKSSAAPRAGSGGPARGARRGSARPAFMKPQRSKPRDGSGHTREAATSSQPWDQDANPPASPTSTSVMAVKTRLFRKLFSLPREELWFVAPCAMQKSVMMHGTMYLSSGYVCFHSNVFGQHTTLKLQAAEIAKVRKTTTGGLFRKGILIRTWNGDRYTFRHFKHLNTAFKLLSTICDPRLRYSIAVPTSASPSLSHRDATKERPRTRDGSTRDAIPIPPHDRDHDDDTHRTQARSTSAPAARQPNGNVTVPKLSNHDDDKVVASDSEEDVGDDERGMDTGGEDEEEEEEHFDPDAAHHAIHDEEDEKVWAERLKQAAADKGDDEGSVQSTESSLTDEYDALFQETKLKLSSIKWQLPDMTSPREFFDMFLADDAVFGFDEFQRMEGNYDIRMSAWSKSPLLGWTRDISLTADIHGAPPWVAKRTAVTKVMRRTFLDDALIMDRETASAHVPYGSTFRVVDRWEVRRNSNGKGYVLTLLDGVRFVQAIRIPGVKGLIKKRCRQENVGSVKRWMSLATPFWKDRVERLKQQAAARRRKRRSKPSRSGEAVMGESSVASMSSGSPPPPSQHSSDSSPESSRNAKASNNGWKPPPPPYPPPATATRAPAAVPTAAAAVSTPASPDSPKGMWGQLSAMENSTLFRRGLLVLVLLQGVLFVYVLMMLRQVTTQLKDDL